MSNRINSPWDYKYGGVVVADSDGKHRFSYPERLVHSYPIQHMYAFRICIDVLSHILVSSDFSDTIQTIDKDGKFLTYLWTSVKGPRSLSYDSNSHLLRIGTYKTMKCLFIDT